MPGVGMDDAFVLLAAWRRTPISMSVPERLGHTYAEAAVSITITSLTNFISFMIGIVTPFPSVRIFCIYTSVAVLFTYAYHITFFGATMAYFGQVERNNLHGLICVPVVPKSLAADKGFFFRLFCTGGRNPSDPDNPEDNKEHMMIAFFRDVVAEALNRPAVKALVIVIFLIYLVIGIYGCSVIKEGLDRRKLSRDDSYSVQFYDFEDKYFREYPYRIQVVINETMNYADPKVQATIEDLMVKFEANPFVAESGMSESWLRTYLQFLKTDDSFIFLQALNVSDPLDFYRGYRDIFLHFPMTEPFRYDVVFNEDGSEVIASRFLIQTKHVMDANMEKEMLITLREIADSFPFPVTIYHHYFIFFDQFVLVRSISIQTITVAAIVMMIISLVFIPSPSCAIWVAFSIISIEIGVIGYMTLWNVNLDSISMINLIMCIGFSVDFSAHISYAYYSCNERYPRDRVRVALTSLGMPIFQGSVSTVLGIIALAFAPSYVFVTFFKTVFLVMLFGATHGLFLLPVLLSITDICNSEPKTLEEVLTAESPDRKHLPHHQHHFKSSNLTVAHKDSPFFTTDKYFNGKAIVHKSGGPIFIPRPSFIGAYDISADSNPHLAKLNGRSKVVDEVSVEGSKSLSVSDVAEKDMGLGTSAEECSESSWKGGEKNDDVIKKQPTHKSNKTLSHAEWSELSPHVNGGYVSDSADQADDEFSKQYGVPMSRELSKSSDIAESRRIHRSGKATGPAGKQTAYQQARLGAYHGPQQDPSRYMANYSQERSRNGPSSRQRSSSRHPTSGNADQPRSMRFNESEEMFRISRPHPTNGEFDIEYNAYWEGNEVHPHRFQHR